MPLRSHGSLSLNRSLMAAGLVDLLQVTIFLSSPVRPERDHVLFAESGDRVVSRTAPPPDLSDEEAGAATARR